MGADQSRDIDEVPPPVPDTRPDMPNLRPQSNIRSVPEYGTPPRNQTILQAYEWYLPSDHKHWIRLAQNIPALSEAGITSLWIPPACKTFHRDGVGYDPYDLYDLGEFNQKGTVRTKYGTKPELLYLNQIAATSGVGLIFDVVLNHKAGADYCEDATGTRVDPQDRLKEIKPPEHIRTWTGFNFPGRQGKYSTFWWNKSHFTGIDYNDITKRNGIWKLEGKDWAPDVHEELGNYDYLMFCDIDHRNPEVRHELFSWIEWLGGRQLKLAGVRLDAIKHISRSFVRDFIRHIRRTVGNDYLIIGEYLVGSTEYLCKYIELMDNQLVLYDFRLLDNFKHLSMAQRPDLTTILNDTLVGRKPDHALSFVTNHDTQEGQAIQTIIMPWFIPLAYALILLHKASVYPCVFWGDLYGSFGPLGNRREGTYEPPDASRRLIPKMMLARKLFAYGEQSEYFDQPHCIGFTRHGHPGHSGGAGLAVVMSASWSWRAAKRMFVGRKHAGELWTDVLCKGSPEVRIDENGWGEFPTRPKSVAVFVDVSAIGRVQIDEFVFNHNIYGFGNFPRPEADSSWTDSRCTVN